MGQQIVLPTPSRATILAGYRLDDMPEDPIFDDLVYLAADICEAPISTVSIIEDQRQWFKAKVGLPVDVCDTTLDRSVCVHGIAHAAEQEGLLIIPDLKRDPRTAENPIVSERPPIRFYAGAPLKTSSGDVLGMLCVADHYPRPMGLTQRQTRALLSLGRQATMSFEMHRLLCEFSMPPRH